jgi:hypothetical protein
MAVRVQDHFKRLLEEEFTDQLNAGWECNRKE